MSSNTASVAAPGYTSTGSDSTNIRWFVCALLFAATTINYMDRSALALVEPLLHLPFMGWLPGVAPAYQSAYHVHYSNIIICFQIAYGVGFLFAGRIIDKLGTKTGYALAILIWACASLSHSLVTSVIGFCIARVFLGIGESGNFPAAIKATTEWFPTKERALATGLFNSGSSASFFIAPLLIAFVTTKWGWNAAFICTGSMGLCWCILWLLFPYNRLRRASTQTQANLEADFASYASSGEVLPWSALLRRRGFYAFAVGKGFTDPIWWFYLFYLPMFLHDNYNLDLNHAKYPLIIIYSASTVGSIGGGWLSGFLMCQRWPQDSHAHLRTVCAAADAGAAPARSLPKQRVARDRALLPGHRGPPGLVGKPLLHADGYVPIHFGFDGRRNRRSGWRCRWRGLHLDRRPLLLAASDDHLHSRGFRLRRLARDLPTPRAAPRSQPCRTQHCLKVKRPIT